MCHVSCVHNSVKSYYQTLTVPELTSKRSTTTFPSNLSITGCIILQLKSPPPQGEIIWQRKDRYLFYMLHNSNWVDPVPLHKNGFTSRLMKFPDGRDESYLDRLLHNRLKLCIGQTGIRRRATDYTFSVSCT